MNERAAIPVIGYTIAEGNPADGFSMYGFFKSKDGAIEAAEKDQSISADWWLMPVYEHPQETKTAKPNEIAAQLRSNMFAERATIEEAMAYAYELIHTLRAQDRIAAITALHVLTNTIANAITAQEPTA